MFKRLFAALAFSAASAAGAQAASVDTATWSTVNNIGQSCGAGSWVASGASASHGSNQCTARVSDFSLAGDFGFTGTMRSTGSDDDNMGVVFGYTDNANNFRMGWESRLGGGGGYGDISGARNFWIVRESGGVSNALVTTGDRYVKGRTYEFSIMSVGGDIMYSLYDTVAMSFVVNGTVAAGGSTDGRVGVYVESQSAVFGDLAAAKKAVVPLPAALPLLVGGLGALGAVARRRGAA